jgi:carboxypeptidase Taq
MDGAGVDRPARRKRGVRTLTAEAAYEELIRRAKALGVLASCSSVLGWDEQTYMPPGGAAHRGEQMALLAGLAHEKATDPRFGELLAAVEGSGLVANPEGAAAVNVRELRRAYDRRVRLPRELVEELARTTSLAQQEWIAARRDSDGPRFAPWLEKIVRLKRQEAACLIEALPDRASATAYDALLDDYEPGARSGPLATLFQALRGPLAELVRELGEASRRAGAGQGDSVFRRRFPVDRQKVFGEAVAAAVGFDFQRGRLDVTAHPFCSGIGPGDTRITTRYDEHQFGDAFFGVLHEVGHGLYEQGLPAEHFGTPLGEAASLGVHESQSRLWENAVGRSRAFWAYWFPLAQRIFHEALHDVSLDRFLAAVHHVQPSLIRVQADEVTYNLHILIRTELEQALLSGDLPVGELPGAWDRKYQDLLGLSPPGAAEGWLQDIHWSAGLFGYFPTYTLGNLYSAQLFDRACTELGGLEERLARGESSDLLAWLRDRVHRHGQRYRPLELIERASGAKVDHRPLLDSLRRRYAEPA